MRIVSYRSGDGEHRAGVQTAAGILDAGSAMGGEALTVRRLLESGRIEELRGSAEKGVEPVSGEEPALLPPVPDPEKLICIGLNYRSHAEEAGIAPPQVPTIFAKFRNALSSPGSDVKLPEASEKLDYEAEVAFVIGRRAKDVSREDAMDHVAGFTLLNDLSARDWQFATPQWMPGKVFDGSAPCGPALVTPDEAGAHDSIEFKLELNGETMQDAVTSDLIFSVPELVAHLSRWMTLEPGDVIATGTPSGVGSVREPRVWLKQGDEVVISSPTLGTLRTGLV
ncbi:MAG: 5-carboxymethyl-2-hydroxymuconate isomerase [Solirubrobacterales bacterium]|jgi:2-keto-4-pentenoate hydratase/2-oxohepta-3-ene-1,7-dioic acid hydratase in catechol pathway|nr:5-carboxymethyl-2-hydroxymuconate isomerase [Solirubrobacterales bacterium]